MGLTIFTVKCVWARFKSFSGHSELLSLASNLGFVADKSR